MTVLDRKEGEKLVAPWIGDGRAGCLPIPRIIRVVVDDKAPPDFVALEKALQRRSADSAAGYAPALGGGAAPHGRNADACCHH